MRIAVRVACTFVAAAVAAGCGPVADDDAGAPPNVVLVLADALRRDHVGLYGYPKPTTPYIDELAAGGVVFDDAMSQAPQTLNSTASLFTSRRFPLLLRGVEHDPIPGIDPSRKDQWARTPRLAAANLTVAEVLHRGGYQTVAMFNNPHHHSSSGFWQGFDDARLLDRDPDQAYARIDTVVDAFLGWHARRDPARPYFAYLHLMDPHNPYRPPAGYRDLFPPGDGRHLYANGTPDASFTAGDLETMTALYDAEIRFVDDTLRALVGTLELRGDLDDTLIILTADHGDELLDHGGLGHGKTVELELLRIPLIMVGPAVGGATGGRLTPLVRNLDLAPTVVELAGLEVPPTFQGTSLVTLLRGTGPARHPAAVSYAWIAQLRSLTSSEWHCMRNLAIDRLTLYHRTTDPRGLVDVAAEHPELAELCRAELDRLEVERVESERLATALKAIETRDGTVPVSAGVAEQLEALGYVE